MSYVYVTLSWVFGLLFLLTGLVWLVDSIIVGFLLIGAAGFLLPPVRAFVHAKTGREMSTKARSVVVFVLLAASGLLGVEALKIKEEALTAEKARQNAEMAAKAKEERLEYFNRNKGEIMSSLRSSLVDGEYQAVLEESSKYLFSGDEVLEEINAEAKRELAARQQVEKTENVLSELNSVEKGEFKRKKDLYQELLTLHPDSSHYKERFEFYSEKVAEQIAVAERRERIESQFSPWDGAHRNLERSIKEGMHDPDSYDHVETRFWDRGDHLIVLTTFRGKNAFGGVVRNSVKARVSLDGRVEEILEQY